ncbi:putative glucose regulated repressor protein [Hibiscus syriacus]|uniref:Glucose regulated repressor protein n=1 Tax=Hibiscus syriacus TaxID=106335 RepID=A0A6A2Y0H7_HIBSY|nr:putative glucose regulated repressor protein [Hibiscus syriacus]
MGSLSGMIQRPLAAAVAVAMASVSADFTVKRPSPSSDTCSTSEQIETPISYSLLETKSSFVGHIASSKLASLSFVTRIRVPLPNANFPVPNSGRDFVPNVHCSSIVSSPLLVNLYQSPELSKASKPVSFKHSIPASAPDVLYRWHLPELSSIDVNGNSDCSSEKSRTVVVLLGCYQAGGKAEQNVEMLVNHLADWLEEEYGVILEKFQKQDPSLMRRIRDCIVDSAPVAAPDPQVWASGFSAAFLKKHSVATKGCPVSSELDTGTLAGEKVVSVPKPAVTEAALLVVLEKFFEVVLNFPGVSRRLSGVLVVLSSGQPTCPQLYMYSSADQVIPANFVESFGLQLRLDAAC